MAWLPTFGVVAGGSDGSLIPPVLRPLFHLPELAKFIEGVWNAGVLAGIVGTALFFVVLWLIVLSVCVALLHRNHRS